MTSDWKECKIEEITDILGDGLHGTPIYSQNGKYSFVNGNNLVNSHIEIKPDTKKVSSSEYEKYKKQLNNRTLLVSINGTLGNVAEYNNEKIILGTSACYFNVKNNISKSFIKYVLISNKFQDYLENNATGTTIKNISLKQMREYEFLLPPLETQQII
jgi:type I restriction enzyme S subunit